MPRANKRTPVQPPLSMSAFMQLDLLSHAPAPTPTPTPTSVVPVAPTPTPRVQTPAPAAPPAAATPTPRTRKRAPVNDGVSAAQTLTRGLRGTITGRIPRATTPMPRPPLTEKDHVRFPARDAVLLLAGAPGEWSLRAPYLRTNVDQALVVPYAERDNSAALLTIVPYHDLTIVTAW